MNGGGALAAPAAAAAAVENAWPPGVRYDFCER